MSNESGWSSYHQARAARSRKEAERFWARFVEATSPDIRRFAGWRLRTSGAQERLRGSVEPDDILLEAYCALYASERPVRNPRAWLCRVIRRIVSRLKRRRPAEEVELDRVHEGYAGRAQEQERAPLAKPDDHSSNGSPRSRRLVRRAIQRLPPMQRRLVFGWYYLNIPRDELPAWLGIKPNSVTQLHLRAIKSLGGLLGNKSN